MIDINLLIIVYSTEVVNKYKFVELFNINILDFEELLKVGFWDKM